ncbi:DUF2846 domain-containing protein [Agarivorans sp. 1_MG-2023]|uniref:DUF2846 domain-containing protein n=1 Tax=Agarivorans sp. 1_MG-2023 TaxID=3062634 RepID=UPI0026E12121|nr:DUF2846 domain-containing protein [Agarivorans sp. 1_MG-2023]MDO6762119.1 DUF2846 domain-containing protein [Agarivorans sp. 1_MG-2023]
MKFRFIAMAFLAFTLTACTSSTSVVSSGNFEGLSNAEAEKGTIFVYRDSSFAGAANQYDVMLNGELVGSLPNGSFFSLELAPSENKIEPKTLTSTGFGKGTELSIEKGTVQCLKLTLNFCLSCKSADIDLVEQPQCEAEIKSLSKVSLR